MATCKHALVTIQKVRVDKSESYGFWNEPGASAEWLLTFTVAGESATMRIDGVRNPDFGSPKKVFYIHNFKYAVLWLKQNLYP